MQTTAPEAVVLAIPVPGASPLDVLAGLPLVTRTVLTLAKEGVSRLTVVAPAGTEGDAIASALEDRRVRIEACVVRAADPRRPLASLERPAGTVLVAMHHRLVDPAFYRALIAALGEPAPVVAAYAGGEPAGPLLASPAFIAAAAERGLEDALADFEAKGEVSRVQDRGWAARADTELGRKRAFFELFEACRKPVDGVVARHLNRHVSIFISKRLVGTPITPNAMSVVTFLLGVAATVLVARGGYWSTLAGAFLFQWNSILDGVDGELARVRFQHSRLGQWLDTVSDDLSNVLFYAGLGYGARHLPFGAELATMGYVAAAVGVVTAAVYYEELWRIGSGDLYAIDWGFDKKPPPGLRGKLVIFFRYVLKKDFALLFFLVLAVLGVLSYALPIIFTGQISVFIAAIGRRIRRARAA